MSDHPSPGSNGADAPGASAPGSEAPPGVAPHELLERRRFIRPIPAAHVIEGDEDEAWKLWSELSGPQAGS